MPEDRWRIEKQGDAFVPVESDCCSLCYDEIFGDCTNAYCECHAADQELDRLDDINYISE